MNGMTDKSKEQRISEDEEQESKGLLIEETLTGFLDEVASDSPAPGGGSVAALAGGLSAALAAMVCRLTYNKEQFQGIYNEIKDMAIELDDTKGRFIELIDEDTEAFNEVMAAYRMSKNNDEQKKERKKAIQMATKNAIRPPLEVCRLSLNVIELAKIVADRGNESAITDAGVATIMAKAAYDSARLNIIINLTTVKDEEFKQSIMGELDELGQAVERTTLKALQIVNNKLKK
jgi:formiminotetrahydrofolate cyclodeaminase